MTKLQRKPTLFKNDFFGFKRRRFKRRVNAHLKKDIKLKTELIVLCLNGANKVGMPKNKQEAEVLEKLIKTFDNTMKELDEKMKYPRIYIETSNEEGLETTTKSET